MTDHTSLDTAWPSLRVDDWTPTRDTLHMWTQIVGKVRLALSPMVNHWWQVTFYVSARGLTTGAIPYGTAILDFEFDFCDHTLRIRSSDGSGSPIALEPKPVAEFYAQVMRALRDLGVDVRITATPNEVVEAIPFAEDTTHRSYDPHAATLFWRQLVQADRILREFRSHYTGKVSPVHFFWGAMDLACTRFSGRAAPPHPGGAPNCGDWVMVEGYSHELSSCGFWPGGGEEGAFYAYAYPVPEGFAGYPVGPDGAYYSEQLGEFVLPYERVRTAADPDAAALEFLHDTYRAAAELGHWDRAALECNPERWNPR
ncbi:DUF5996 family protein [Rhodococcus olei]|uniref:DUF5996 family protein n=1 Tax=Rhodococcus olei TaxID=2161675 RepID=A0ABP8P8N9_9NOCA